MDTEVYRARDTRTGCWVALKIARRQAARAVSRMLAHEARVLSVLHGRHTVSLLASGEVRGRPYVATRWSRGESLAAAATRLRAADNAEGGRRMASALHQVALAYAQLHEQGVIHADVQPGNVLIDQNGRVRILDFGLSGLTREEGARARRGRASLVEFMEPECAKALLEGTERPAPSRLGEQYSVAAMLYAFLTGSEYVQFALQQDAALKQVCHSPMLSFASQGVRPWPEMENVLSRALSKAKEGRFSTMREFAEAIGELSVRRIAAKVPRWRGQSNAARWSAQCIRPLTSPSNDGIAALWTSPTASVYMGAAGGAAGLLRMAECTGSGQMLAAADLWAARAVASIRTPGAFFDRANGIHPQLIGRGSLYNGRPGVFCAQALVARAIGNRSLQLEATAAFIESTTGRFRQWDLTLGTAGIVLGCASLASAAWGMPRAIVDLLLRHGDRHLANLRTQLDANTSLTGRRGATSVAGMAHGWAGALYAALTWMLVRGGDVPTWVLPRLDELSNYGGPDKNEMTWPVRVGKATSHAGPRQNGWCAGGAGFVHLWTLAFQATSEQRYLELAVRTGGAVAGVNGESISLCCGLAGRAYSLLTLYRATGEPKWVHRAERLAQRALMCARVSSEEDLRLYKGPLGLAVLQTEFECPEQARMPFFEMDAGLRFTANREVVS